MKIEEFKDIKIAYMRRIGEYGLENKSLMEKFKLHLEHQELLDERTIILGIALDNPLYVSKENQRYDVGMIISDENIDYNLPIRNIDNGQYAVFEVEHDEKAISEFWENIQTLTADLVLDDSKPIIERYTFPKIASNLCEFCIPLK
ncbi:GyrI-like domain-containing protein [Catellicoccus marimammalium]|uniref:Transcriptional regulator, AraC family n=1 Tax=Catellicoccus marimammalium M35/04/3 TaxID=1234409 RepID=K8Z9N3_9ENTE|nr:GyrI-like domain-containing protein [Catellicoccus marimammalium]EKU27764.1 Transcriptional regulator, AraC family [Catellicoccus marimammalium M35/04/3]